jgi:hypothetical protein
MSDTIDVARLGKLQMQAREQGENSNSITARIAHYARADAYAEEIEAIKNCENLTDDLLSREPADRMVRAILAAIAQADLDGNTLLGAMLTDCLDVARTAKRRH